MQKIYDEQKFKMLNKDTVSVTSFSFCHRLQYGLAWHWKPQSLVGKGAGLLVLLRFENQGAPRECLKLVSEPILCNFSQLCANDIILVAWYQIQ